MSEHTADLRNVTEGDHVTIETTADYRFEGVECTGRENAKTYQRFSFDVKGRTVAATVIDGFPDKQASLAERESTGWELLGWFESVEIHGPMPGA